MADNKRRSRVLLADDNRDMLEAVKSILGSDYEVVGAVNDGLQLVKAEASLEPDIGIVDISMPVMNGITAAGELHAITLSPSAGVVVCRVNYENRRNPTER